MSTIFATAFPGWTIVPKSTNREFTVPAIGLLIRVFSTCRWAMSSWFSAAFIARREASSCDAERILCVKFFPALVVAPRFLEIYFSGGLR